jgi:integrase
MGKPRKPKNRKYPENLYIEKTGRCRYRRPDTGERIPLGTIGKNVDENEAIEAAIQANNKYWKRAKLLDRIDGPDKKQKELVSSHLDYMLAYWDKRVAEDDMSKVTLDTYRRQVNHFRDAFPNRYFNSLTRLELSTFLEKFPTTLKMRYRAVLSVVWKHAISRGLTEINIIDSILKEKTKVLEKRLTMETYKKIRAHAEPHFQNAFDLALETTQRRRDISAMLKENIISINGTRYLRVKQIKGRTRNKGGALVQIEITPELDEVFKRCQDNVVSRYIIHYPYSCGRLAGKRISPDTLTRAFQEARDKAIKEDGIFKGMTNKQLPVFRSIRSLGAKMMEEANKDPQLLLGHADKKMTQVYLDRYEEKWVIAKAAGIKI